MGCSHIDYTENCSKLLLLFCSTPSSSSLSRQHSACPIVRLAQRHTPAKGGRGVPLLSRHIKGYNTPLCLGFIYEDEARDLA